MVAKKIWDTKNPKSKSTPLTPAQKASAKAAAKKAGRPYPNLVDNMAASRKTKMATHKMPNGKTMKGAKHG